MKCVIFVTKLMKEKESYAQFTQMIDAELHLVTLDGPPVRTDHDAGVVDEQVEAAELSVNLLAERAHRVQVGQVEVLDVDAVVLAYLDDLLGGLLGVLHVLAGHDDVGAAARKVQRGLVADARVGTGNDHNLVVQPLVALVFRAAKVESIGQVAQ
jgi:hypothetical protein